MHASVSLASKPMRPPVAWCAATCSTPIKAAFSLIRRCSTDWPRSNSKRGSQLRDRKLENLALLRPQMIASANIGCIQRLQSGTITPVKHSIEVLDAALNPEPKDQIW